MKDRRDKNILDDTCVFKNACKYRKLKCNIRCPNFVPILKDENDKKLQ